MNNIKIHSYKDYSLLYEGTFENTNDCIENAVQNNVSLAYADLQYSNLSNINLDNAIMPYADFTGSNLSGANLSESMLNGALFKDAVLYNTCFAYSEIQACDFKGASFGATDITGANISFSEFSTLSCFSLDFSHVRAMKQCLFLNAHGQETRMSRPPVVVKGISKKPIIMMKDRTFHGHMPYDYGRLMSHLNRFLTAGDNKRLKNNPHKLSG